MSLGHHVNVWQGNAVGSVRAAPGSILKVLNTAIDRGEIQRYRAARPDGLVLYRHVFPDGTPRDVGPRCQALLASVAPIKDLVDVVETPWNEEMQDFYQLGNYATMTKQAVAILEAAGFRTAIGNFSTSQPELSDFALFAPALVRSARTKYLSVHEYGAPRMQDGGGCLRYRHWQSLWSGPILVTECGIDGGVLGPNNAKQGWRNFTDAATYAAQLAWYGAETNKDKVRAAIFACGTFDDWSRFDIAGEGAIEKVIRESGGQPMPPAVTTFTVGPGVLAEMTKHGDAPTSDEKDIGGIFAIASGAKGIYIYVRQANRTYFLQAA